jgi:uncharacterized protein (TIGR02266 family)
MGLLQQLRGLADRATRRLKGDELLVPEGSARRELRGDVRVPVDLHVTLRFDTPSEAIRSRALDISEGGIFIATSSPRDEATLVYLTLEIAGYPLKLEGVVARSVYPPPPGQVPDQRPGMGIVFTDMDDATHQVVSELVAKRKARRA